MSENREMAGKPRGNFDDLTGLPARPWYDHMLESELARSKRYKHTLSQIVVFIDGFSQFTAKNGPASSDYILMTIADLLRKTVRVSDEVSRVSADGFAIVLPETDVTGAKTVGEKIRRSVELYPFDEGFEITVSVGIAAAKEADSPDSYFERAETAVRAVREKGGNACLVSST